MKVWLVIEEEDAGDQWYHCNEVKKIVDSLEKVEKELEGKHRYDQCINKECMRYHWKYKAFDVE